MQKSLIGQIVQKEWDKSFEMRNELFCEAFVLMPNQICAIIRIDNGLETMPVDGTVPIPLSKHSQSKNKNHGIAIRPPKSIFSFVAGFKSDATKRINEFLNTPNTAVWQSRFHGQISCTEVGYYHVCNDIKNNPANREKNQAHF